MAQRKLGRPADQRKALLRNQVTALLWHGRIEPLSTVQRKFAVWRKTVTLAVRSMIIPMQATKKYHNEDRL